MESIRHSFTEFTKRNSNTSLNSIDSNTSHSNRSSSSSLSKHERRNSLVGRLASMLVTESEPSLLDLDTYITKLNSVRTYTIKPILKFKEMDFIIKHARELIYQQPVLLELRSPVTIVGDIHGQYSDLLKIFEKGGDPSQTNYLFLGDYVDRGNQSLETILLLLCYKIKHPETFFLLRGNHEVDNVNRVYGFYDECKRRVSVKLWRIFSDCFSVLPIAAIVSDKIFCVHGGLSPDLKSMDEIRNLQRPLTVSDSGLVTDLLWSDPSEEASGFEFNQERGASYVFGKNELDFFLTYFEIELVIRAHMVVEDGYKFFNNRTLVTIFSVPNYCGEFENNGCIVSVNEHLKCSFQIIHAVKKVVKSSEDVLI
ncbi:Metallo-dependent phosphatase-like protein [Globomyces pollinis-pini]|nr:Metallo-dependent phosphatase-like protein [Globomyces pollinis-pini]